jgi:hypothetical protein
MQHIGIVGTIVLILVTGLLTVLVAAGIFIGRY